MRKIASIIIIIVALAAAVCGVYFFVSNIDLKTNLTQARLESSKYQEEISRILSERERGDQEKDKLQQDTVVYLTLNSKLQEENRKLLASLDEARLSLKGKDKDSQKGPGSLAGEEAKVQNSTTQEKQKILKHYEEIKQKTAELEQAAQKERRMYYYNLAVAYTKAKMYEDAIESYEKALALDEDNAEAHYNLGLIYEKVKKMPSEALGHYEKFLQLAPDNADAREVAEWVKRLTREKVTTGGNGSE
jgi:tetratricopeptide (TPR) repeat protein